MKQLINHGPVKNPEQVFSEYVDDLKLDGRELRNHLQKDEVEKLTGLIIKKTKLIDQFEFITEADTNNELPHLLASVLDGTQKASRLLDAMKENATKYAENEIKKFFPEEENDADSIPRSYLNSLNPMEYHYGSTKTM